MILLVTSHYFVPSTRRECRGGGDKGLSRESNGNKFFVDVKKNINSLRYGLNSSNIFSTYPPPVHLDVPDPGLCFNFCN